MAIFIVTIACNLTRMIDGTWECGEKDDTTPSLKMAIKLYRRLIAIGEKDVYIVATAKESPLENNILMCEAMKNYLRKYFIPEHAIVIHTAETWNTFGEIIASYEAIAGYEAVTGKKARKVFICARWFHVWRACLMGYYIRRAWFIKTPQIPAPTGSNIKWVELPQALLHELLGIFQIPLYLFSK